MTFADDRYSFLAYTPRVADMIDDEAARCVLDLMPADGLIPTRSGFASSHALLPDDGVAIEAFLDWEVYGQHPAHLPGQSPARPWAAAIVWTFAELQAIDALVALLEEPAR